MPGVPMGEWDWTWAYDFPDRLKADFVAAAHIDDWDEMGWYNAEATKYVDWLEKSWIA